PWEVDPLRPAAPVVLPPDVALSERLICPVRPIRLIRPVGRMRRMGRIGPEPIFQRLRARILDSFPHPNRPPGCGLGRFLQKIRHSAPSPSNEGRSERPPVTFES